MVISITCATCPAKASPNPTLGAESNPFYVSILHPRPFRGIYLCCANIGPVYTFRPDILRAALRVFLPPGCKVAAWSKALSWFWKTMEQSKGRKCARGTLWVDTSGLNFWVSLRNDMVKALYGAGALTADLQLGRTVFLEFLDDLLRRNYSPSPPLRHVLHTERILDPGTLMPAFDPDSDDGKLRLLCGIEPGISDDEQALVRCYNRLFDVASSLLHEPLHPLERNACGKLVDLRIARLYVFGERSFYFSPHRVLPGSIEALCHPPSPVFDSGAIGERPLDHLAQLLTLPIEDYLIVYDSTVTPDSPLRRLLLEQFKTASQDLVAVSTEAVDFSLTDTMTQRIRQVKSRIYRVRAETRPIITRPIKTVFLLDFGNWRLQQLRRLCSCFATSRIMSRARAAWVALNITSPVFSERPLDPTEWTENTPVKSVLSWFDVNVIQQ